MVEHRRVRRDERDLYETRRNQASCLSRSPFFHSRVSPHLHLAIIGHNNSLHSQTKPFFQNKSSLSLEEASFLAAPGHNPNIRLIHGPNSNNIDSVQLPRMV